MSDFRGRIRQLSREPGYVAVVLFSLGVGMTTCVAAFSLVNTLIFASIPGIEDRSNLLRIGWSDERAITPLEFETMQADAGAAFGGIAAEGHRRLAVTLPSEPAVVPAAFVSPAFFEVLGTHAVAGRLLSPADALATDAPRLVIAETLWRSAFGRDAGVIGREFLVGGRPFTIVGVTPAGFPGLQPSDVGQKARDLPQVWIPLRFARSWTGADSSRIPWLRVAARLRRGVPLSTARAQVQVIGKRLNAGRRPAAPEVSLRVLRAGLEWRDAPFQGLLVVMLYLFVPLSVLAIGCTNVLNLQLARAAQRAGELSIRLAIGASRARIIRLLALDVAILAPLAGTIGWIGARAALTAAQPLFPIPLAVDARVLVFAFVIVAAVISVAGGIPGWLSARDIVAPGLRDVEGAGRAHARVRGALVIVQVAASVALLSISGLALRALAVRTPTVPRHSAQILVAEVNLADVRSDAPRPGLFAGAVLDRLGAEPSIAAAAWATFIAYGRPIRYWRTSDPAEPPRAAFAGMITAGWFDATRAAFLAGRPPAVFGHRPTEAVVSAGLAAQLTGASGAALGAPLRMRHPEDGSMMSLEVVGVIADSFLTAEGQPLPMVYIPMSADAAPPALVLVVRSVSPDAVDDARRAIRSAVAATDPAVPFVALQTLEARLRDFFTGGREIALFGLILGTVALVLAGTGLYALIAFMVRRRIREIGIRLAIGAAPLDVLLLVLRLSAGLTIAGALCGLGIAFPIASAMRALLVGVSPLDPWTMVSTIGGLLLVALAATAIPAYRAATVDPAATLRHS